MAEGIRLQFSLIDKFSAELKKPESALSRLSVKAKDVSFKFQFAWAQMEDAVKRFSVSSMSQKIKALAATTKAATDKIKNAFSNMALHAARATNKFAAVFNKVRTTLTSMPALIASSAIGLAFGAAIKQGLAFNSTVETLGIQFEVLTGSAERSKNIMAELVTFAAKTPFQLEEVATSARILMAFGVTGKEMLRRVGDAAAAANRPLDEVAMTFGRIKSGAFGEAFMRLAEMGIATREMLEAEGLKFNKGGSYVGSVDDAMNALNRIVDRRFKGMMDRMSGTLAGKFSTLKDDLAATLGAVTKPLFDRLKPRLDALSAALQRSVTSGLAQALGMKIASPIIWAIDKVIWGVDHLPQIYDAVAGALLKVSRGFATVAAGFKWVYNLVENVALLLASAFEVAIMEIKKAWYDLPFVDTPIGFEIDLKKAKDNLSFLKDAVKDAWSSPGARASWEGSSGRKADTLGRGRGGGGPQQTGPGLDEPSTGGPAMSGEEALARWNAFYARLSEIRKSFWGGATTLISDTQIKIWALQEDYHKQQQKLWTDHWATMADVVSFGFTDIVTANILQSGDDLKQALDSIWVSMKDSFVRNAVQMGVQWIRNRIKMAIAERAIVAASAGAQAAAAGPKVAALTAETSASAGAATAGYYAALSYLGPFGTPIAAALTAQMNAAIMFSKAVNMGAFRTGGIVGGGGSGNEDNRFVQVSGGEGILNKPAVDFYGRDTVRAMNRLQAPRGGEVSLTVPITVNGGGGVDASGLRRDIEREVGPILERLVRQRRLRLA